jgi:hypothetical protein
MKIPATCLHEMELKIRAWAFVAPIKTDNTIPGLQKWKPHESYSIKSNFIASLRDDVRLIRGMVTGATLVVSSLGATPPMPDMPRAVAYPAKEVMRD